MAEQLQQTLAEATLPRSRSAVLRGPGATRLRSLPPLFTRSAQFEAASQPTRGTGAPEAYRTPADYRTALLSDSPQGCPLSAEVQDSGERPGREAGVWYSARRAPRGRGRCPPLLLLGASLFVARIPTEVERRPAALADRPEARGFGEERASAARSRSPQSPKDTAQPAGAPGTGEKTSTQQPKHTPVAAGIGASDPKKVRYFQELDRGGDGYR
jgi:hypothetical protein